MLEIKDTTVKYWNKVNNPYDAISIICDNWDSSMFDDELIPFNIFPIPNLLDKDKIILDVACGIGRRAKFISSSVKQYIGVDFSDNMIALARERYKDRHNVSFFHNDGKTLDMITDNTIDIAICELAFQHMKKKTIKSYINEVYRVLKPGGVFISQVPKFDYYKNKNYSFSMTDNEQLFYKYSKVEYLNNLPKDYNDHAYFYMKVTR